MSENYGRDIIKLVVAQMCQTVGFDAVRSIPLEVLTDVSKKYITKLAETSHRYAEQFGHTRPNLYELGLVFRDMNISLPQMREYVEFVSAIPFQRELSKFPLKRQSHLNILRPGSREVITRPLHIHEHLPAMHNDLEDDNFGIVIPSLAINTCDETASLKFSCSKPYSLEQYDDVQDNSLLIKSTMPVEEQGQPLREISSVIMTTSGFLSSACEGKQPDAHMPRSSHDSVSTELFSSSYSTVSQKVKGKKRSKKKSVDKKVDSEHKHKVPSNLTNPFNVEYARSKMKKGSKKKLAKLKAFKFGALKIKPIAPDSKYYNEKLPKLSKSKSKLLSRAENMNSSLPKDVKFQSTQSHELSDDTRSLLPESIGEQDEPMSVHTNIDGKLSSEPDKKKMNIFKKILKGKEDKFDRDMKLHSHRSPRV